MAYEIFYYTEYNYLIVRIFFKFYLKAIFFHHDQIILYAQRVFYQFTSRVNKPISINDVFELIGALKLKKR